MPSVDRIPPSQLQKMLHDGSEIALLDVREAGEFGEGHLLFATPLPYSRLEIDMPALVPRKTARVVLCDGGERNIAERAARRLQAMGYSDLRLLEGGTRAWARCGYTLFAGVNVPSKLFGELVEHEYHTPRVSVTELARMREAGEDFVIVDGRPYAEYHKMNIPGGICCPNAELPYRIREIVSNPETKIIVNCAGRTRSILGAQTLINFGVPNPVYALENGTQGWVLADFELERGAERRYPNRIAPSALPGLQSQARELMSRHAVSIVDSATVREWLRDAGRTTYLLDVRTPEEFAAGSIEGATHAPGGQLIQATDQWVGVRNARIVLIDGESVRAPVVASWLEQLGCDAHVLADGIRSDVGAPIPQQAELPHLNAVSPAELQRMLTSNACSVLDLRASMDYRKAHIPESRWSIRPDIAEAIGGITHTIVLVADNTRVARAAAIDIIEAGHKDVRLLQGGFSGWLAAGYGSQATPDEPPDRECRDYLFFVHDRHAGNRAAMKQYLAWETGLIAQLSDEDRKAFRVGVSR